MMTLRILSWNINGLRSFKTDMKTFLSNLDADIICFQETKVTRDMLEEPLAIVDGYSSYYSFSRRKSGYSGVATFCSQSATPCFAQEGLSGLHGGTLAENAGTTEALDGHWTEEELKDLDSEGRAVITQHTLKGSNNKLRNLAVINVYCPRVDPEKPDRRIYKLRFYELLRQRAAAIYATGSHVVILGDVNCSHKRIDHCDPDENEDFELRLERRYLDKFLIPLHRKDCDTPDEKEIKTLHMDSPESSEKFSGNGLSNDPESLLDKGNEDVNCHEYLLDSKSDFQVCDTFRYFYPDQKDAFTCWNTFTNARATNYGTRIDYIFCDEDFLGCVEDSEVLQNIMGSDHCPVAIKVCNTINPSEKLPESCTKYFPEFKGNQQKLSTYFQPVTTSSEIRKEVCTNNSQILHKRKLTNAVKPVPNKKRGSDKQIKLNSYFMAKTKGDDKKTSVSIKPKTNSMEVLSCSQNTISNEICSSKESEKVCSQLGIDMSSESNSQSLEKVNSDCRGLEKSSSVSKNSGWNFLMKGPKPPPLCPGHNEPTVARTVKKKGPNMNRQFYACARGAGREGDPNAQCNFFQWVGKK